MRARGGREEWRQRASKPLVLGRECDEQLPAAHLVRGHVAPQTQGVFEQRPVSGQDGFSEGVEISSHVVGRDQPFAFERPEDLLIESVERRLVEGQRLDKAVDDAVLGVHRHRDRQVARVLLRPGAQLPEAAGQRETAAAEVDVLYVQHLEAGCRHLSL